MSAPPSSLLPLVAAFTGNLAIAVLKGVAAYFTGSGAMLAEAVHSMADTSNQVNLYVGLRGRIVDALQAAPELRAIVELRTLQMGPQSVLVMIDAAVDASDHGGDVAVAVEALEQRVCALDASIKRVYVHPEPETTGA